MTLPFLSFRLKGEILPLPLPVLPVLLPYQPSPSVCPAGKRDIDKIRFRMAVRSRNLYAEHGGLPHNPRSTAVKTVYFIKYPHFKAGKCLIRVDIMKPSHQLPF